MTWELNCSKHCNLCSCSLRLCYWSWKWEKHRLAFVRQNEESISSLILYNLLLFSFWGYLQKLGVTVAHTQKLQPKKRSVILYTEWEHIQGRQAALQRRHSHLRDLTQHHWPAPTTLGRTCLQAHTQKSLFHLQEGALLGTSWTNHDSQWGVATPKKA